MKSTSICPKCSSKEIVVIPCERGTDNWIKVELFTFVKLSRYICASFGYMEQYVEGEKSLSKLHRKISEV
jgi:hypothetical protein